MFLHTVIEKKEIDLDALLNNLQEDSDIVSLMTRKIGSLEYSFIVDSVAKNIEDIKSKTPMPLEDE